MATIKTILEQLDDIEKEILSTRESISNMKKQLRQIRKKLGKNYSLDEKPFLDEDTLLDEEL